MKVGKINVSNVSKHAFLVNYIYYNKFYKLDWQKFFKVLFNWLFWIPQKNIGKSLSEMLCTYDVKHEFIFCPINNPSSLKALQLQNELLVEFQIIFLEHLIILSPLKK
jgi:hypothetical protein